jgi:predicted DNA-binding protein
VKEVIMKSVTVRISKEEREILKGLSKKLGISMTEVLNKAVDKYRKEVFLAEANWAYARLKEKPNEWKDELEERKLWDNTLSGGLEEE